MSNPEKYITEVKELINAYGLEAIAKVLGKTERGIQYWLGDNPKKPTPKTQQKIHELFVKHKNGNSLVGPQEAQSGTFSANGTKQDYLSGKNLENFSEAHRVLATAIAHVLPKSSSDRVLVPKLMDLITEIAGGKKQVPIDDLLKELRKALVRDNNYTQ